MPQAVKVFASLLRVVPVQGNFFVDPMCTTSWNNQATPKCKTYDLTCSTIAVPAAHQAAYSVYPTNPLLPPTQYPGGAGIPNTDFLIYVTAVQDPTNCPKDVTATTGVLAYAGACRVDQYGRPTVATVNFCPSLLNTDPAEFDNQLKTALHETTHALGFSSNLFSYYRDSAGKIRDSVAVDSTLRGKAVKLVSTPSVVDYVRKHFNCDTLAGAEIEDQGATGTVGSHWEKRTFGDEYMTGTTTTLEVPAMSALTMSLLQDSGHYNVDFTSPSLDVLIYGRNLGCSFVDKKCIENGKSNFADYFCTTDGAVSCSFDRAGYGPCRVGKYQSNLPTQFTYFSDPTMGGVADLADYCPVYTAYTNALCRDSVNAKTASYNKAGESYGASGRPSKCFTSSLVGSGWVAQGGKTTAGCYQYVCQCDKGVTSLGITACTDNVKNQCVTKLCGSAGQKLTFTGFEGNIVCPKATDICQYDTDFTGSSVGCALISADSPNVPKNTGPASGSVSAPASIVDPWLPLTVSVVLSGLALLAY
jgi:hypothetical protein